jgi:hypothetical protein
VFTDDYRLWQYSKFACANSSFNMKMLHPRMWFKSGFDRARAGPGDDRSFPFLLKDDVNAEILPRVQGLAPSESMIGSEDPLLELQTGSGTGLDGAAREEGLARGPFLIAFQVCTFPGCIMTSKPST